MATPWNITESVSWTKAASSLHVEPHSGKIDHFLTSSIHHYYFTSSMINAIFSILFNNHRTLQELVEHYSKDSDGLCVNLRLACVQVRVIVLNNSNRHLNVDFTISFWSKSIHAFWWQVDKSYVNHFPNMIPYVKCEENHFSIFFRFFFIQSNKFLALFEVGISK